MTQNRLVLHPRDPDWMSPEDPIPALHRAGLCGAPFEYEGRPCLHTGARFLSWITFLGCAPVVHGDFAHAAEGNFYFLEWLPPTSAIRFLGAHRQPRCPHCRQGVKDWRKQLTQHWQQGEYPALPCSRCNRPTHPAYLDWRRCGGFARCGLIVWGIFESEAVPTDALLKLLLRESGTPWKYFYQCL